MLLHNKANKQNIITFYLLGYHGQVTMHIPIQNQELHVYFAVPLSSQIL